MIAAHISRKAESRKAAIATFLGRTDARQIIYVCPKSILWQAEDLRGRCHVVSFEDLDKRDEWLTVNAMLGPSTALVMEGVTRYPKITSPKFVNLQRLSKQVGDKLLVDHVPFCDGIEYVYTPYSYLDRAILGFAHWYAFREAYDEVAPDGSIVSSHDPAVIARKISTVTTVDGGSALLRDRRVVDAPLMPAEHDAYAKKKSELFAEHKNPTKIVTRLADHAHAAASRRKRIADHVQGLSGRVLVLTNLGSYADKLRKMVKGGDVEVDSFAPAAERKDLGTFDHVVFAESPIVKPYLLLDIEGQLPATATAWTVLSDAKVDTYLNNRRAKEVDQILAVVDAMEARHGS